MFRKISKYFLLAWAFIFGVSGLLAITTDFSSSIIVWIFAGLCFWGFKKLNRPPKTEEEKAEIRLKKEEEKKKKAEMKQLIKEHKKQMIEEEKAKHGNIEFEVAGTFVEERQKLIKKFIKDEIKNEMIEAYGGLSTKEIKEKYEGIEVYEIPEGHIWKGSYKNNGYIKIEKEPDNEYDKNAVKIILEEYGRIGYVPKNQNVEVAKILEEKENISFKMEITGGKYKLWDGDEMETDEEEYGINIKLVY
ncbi:HIRAN domain-containing protein [Fusobacterium necrophorum]|uniref:HIRAN domain-containing protein n=1 Tax=Fusobacterium necrophorum TaxID=859 RepID=A0AAW6W821_9FUSO|nr:HIRAN domain-containing protein [Fusobacterium necrophorum]MDK4479967.1 HIRAN domain-containing protein [Fusobacterium necrophorum]MDK4510756.1 HIRAN domain-containing protein [Fusobacterium necrophorum]